MTTAIQTEPRTIRRRGRPKPSSPTVRKPAARADALRARTRRLLKLDIDFIPNPSFLERALAEPQTRLLPDEARDADLPKDLPGHLARLCESKLLSAEEETQLFRSMNLLKFRAHKLRANLNAEQPSRRVVEQVERCLGEAQAIRDRIVQANMRLVMSIVKKFVTPQHSFDEMLSDGIHSLMQAVEKFDYDRGFRFSTYAYRAIARNAYRRITDRQKEHARFAVGGDDVVFDTPDERGSSSVSDEAWDRFRSLLTELMDRLDRREQFILRSRYALGAHRKVRTFQYLADKLGVSKERVRQLEQRAVAKLKNFASEHELDELVGATFS